MRTLPILALAGLASAAAGGVSSAAAATLAVSRACVNVKQPFAVVGAGFAPGQPVQVGPSTLGAAQVLAGADGSFAVPQVAPASGIDDPVQKPIAVNAYDATSGLLASVPITVAIPKILVEPRVIDARKALAFTLRGFAPGLPAYVHIRLRHRFVRTAMLGTPAAPCGALQVSKRVLTKLPIRRTDNHLELLVDQQVKPSAATRPDGDVMLFLRTPALRPFYRFRAQVTGHAFRDVALPAGSPAPAAR